MRIVLLGATGFVGSYLLPRLSRRGHQCVVLCRDLHRSRALRLIPGVELQAMPKITEEALQSALAGADAAINAVGILNESGRKGRGFFKAHVGVTDDLIKACTAAGVKHLVQISALNAGKGESYYLATKGEAERRLRQAEGLRATIIQPSVIFGQGDSFFTRFAGLLRFTPVLPLACPGALLQPVWVGDVTEAVTRVLERPDMQGKTLPLVGPKVYTLRELVQYAARVAGLRRWIPGLPDALSLVQAKIMDWVPGKPFSTDNYRSLQVPNTSKSNALPGLGIRPRSIKAIVPAYLAGSNHQRRLDQWRETGGR